MVLPVGGAENRGYKDQQEETFLEIILYCWINADMPVPIIELKMAISINVLGFVACNDNVTPFHFYCFCLIRKISRLKDIISFITQMNWCHDDMIYLHEVQYSVAACLASLLLSGLFELLISPKLWGAKKRQLVLNQEALNKIQNHLNDSSDLMTPAV